MPIDRTKLAKLLALSTSSNDAEALAAVRKANEMLAREKLTWQQVLNAPDEPLRPPPDKDYYPYTDRPYSARSTKSAWDQFYESQGQTPPPDHYHRSARAEPSRGNNNVSDGEVVMMLGALHDWARRSPSVDAARFTALLDEWYDYRLMPQIARAVLKQIYDRNISEAVAGAKL